MNVLKVELKKISKGLITWIITICAILAMYIIFFPSMGDSGFNSLANAKIEMLPEAFKKAFGMEEMPNFNIYTEYLAYILQFIMLAVSVYALILGFKSLTSEEQDKTIEFQMANPISRTELVTYKMLTGLIAITALMIGLLLVAIIGGALFAKSDYFNQTIIIVVMSMIPAYIYMFIGFALSTIFKKSMVTTGTSLGMFFGTYIIGIMAGVIDKIKWMKYISPSNYVLSSDVLKSNILDSTKNTFNMKGIYIGIAIVIVSIITTYVLYNKKDMDI